MNDDENEEESWLDETFKVYEEILPDEEENEKKQNFISRKIEDFKMAREAKAMRKEKALWDYIEKGSDDYAISHYYRILKRINEDDEEEKEK